MAPFLPSDPPEFPWRARRLRPSLLFPTWRPWTRSARRELVLLFLDDPYCPTSRAAHAEMVRLGHPAARIDVSMQHDLTCEVARRTGVKHESPQVLVLREDRAVWAASHRAITVASIAGVLGELSAST